MTEYFKPTSQISLIELICDECSVGKVKKIVSEIGTTGNAVDYFFTVKELNEDKEKIC